MIRKLKQKFMWILMTIFTLLLVAVLGLSYVSAKNDYESRSLETLQSALKKEESPPTPGKSSSSNKRKTPPQDRSEFPVLILDVDKNGNVVVSSNELHSVDDDTALSLVELLEQDSSSGVLKEYHLRYVAGKRSPGGSVKYAFTDTYAEENTLRAQMIHSIFIGTAALAVLFLVSLRLSDWAIRPVAKAWEQQQQFVADASHELKTPLTVILSNVSLALHPSDFAEDSSAEKKHRHLLRIQDEANRMKYLVESLLFLAQTDAGQIRSEYKKFDFSALIQSAVLSFESVAFETGKEIVFDVAESVRLHGDEEKIRRLVHILLDNACKYGKKDSVITVNLSLTDCSQHSGTSRRMVSKKEARLTVTSEGAPLSEHDIQNIFLRFYRTDPSRNQVSGYGLGLSIAQNIVSEYGGIITASSDGINKNTFMVSLPVSD